MQFYQPGHKVASLFGYACIIIGLLALVPFLFNFSLFLLAAIFCAICYFYFNQRKQSVNKELAITGGVLTIAGFILLEIILHGMGF